MEAMTNLVMISVSAFDASLRGGELVMNLSERSVRAGRNAAEGGRVLAGAVLAILLAIQGDVARAALIAKDQFLTGGSPAAGQYGVATVIGQNPTIAGFSGGWFSSFGSSMDVSNSSLAYAAGGFPASAGGKLFSNDAGNRVHRSFDATLNPFQAGDSGTAYVSVLMQTTAASGNGYLALEMHNGGNADGNRTFQLGISQGSSDFPSGSNFGFRVNNNSGTLSRSLAARNTTVNLFLMKFNMSTAVNGDSITVWQNPTITSLTVDPAGGTTVSGFEFAADRMGLARFNSSSTLDFSVDELRIGTTLGDVLSNGFLACDVNGNGVCNSTDMRILANHMFQPGSFGDGDLTGDGMVDFADYRLLKDDPNRVVGFDSPGDESVPEPAAIGLLLAAAPALLRRFRAARLRQATRRVLPASAFAAVCGAALVAQAQTRPTGPITTFSGATLQMRRYAGIPTSPIISMSTQPLTAGNPDLFVTTQNGNIYELQGDGSGGASPALFFNYNSAVSQFVANPANGFLLDNTNTTHGGLRNISFHPQFALNGKFYTSALVDTPSGVGGLRYLGPTLGSPAAESVVAEWTYDRVTDAVTGYRELFRVQMPVFDHPVKQMGFNPFAKPGDEDYGLLYIAHGDGSVQSTTTGGGAPNNALGKILRINPLQSGANPYTTPGNVLAGQAGYLPEIFTLGHRNPHHLSFAKDAGGGTHVIVAEPGRDNIEEINVLQNGGNYGWSSREGTWVQLTGTGGFGVGVGLAELPANEWQLNDFVYPAAQYDHDTTFGTGFSGVSVAGGFTIQNHSDPALENQYIFLDFANANGRVYQAPLDDLLGAHTQLADGEAPAALTQAPISRLHLTLDSNGDGVVDRTADDMNTLLQVSRNDARFGRGIDGEMYISSKTTGLVYRVNNTVANVKRLTLAIDRGTGAMTIANNSGSSISITGMSVTSPSGSIAPMNLQTLAAGWTLGGANTNQMATQDASSGSLVLGAAATAPLGDAYDAQLFAFGRPAGEDVVFVFDTAAGDSVLGSVVYTGQSTVPDTIVMTVNLATGEAVLQNQTPFSQEVEGYTITSMQGSINAAGWNTFESQGIDDGDWFATPTSDAHRLTEVQDDGTTTFNQAAMYSLGDIYASGATRDLKFEFLLAGESSLREGIVQYVLPGDFNGDSRVDGADLLIWQRGESPTPGSATDLAAWRTNFGVVVAAAPAASAVPEPAAAWLVCLALGALRTGRSP
jgi:glucose/arabinose dehydrogenase